MTDVLDGIRDYLSSGGLFNPELMDHDRVRALIIECRDEIERLRDEEAYLRVLFQGAGAQRKADVAEIERLRDEVEERNARINRLVEELKVWKDSEFKVVMAALETMENERN